MTENLPFEISETIVSVVPEIAAQAAVFTADTLHAHPVNTFNPAPENLQSKAGQHVIGIDIGGDKIAAEEKIVGEDGRLYTDTSLRSGSRKHGRAYLSVVESLAYRAYSSDIPVGISFAGPVDGTTPLEGPNVSKLMTELQENYGGDFKGASSEEDILLGEKLTALSNDAVAGLYAGAAEAARLHPEVKNVIYVIVGSGLGGALLKDSVVYATEPGHVKVIDELNPYHSEEACGTFSQTFTCVERVASGKAGIEATWAEQTGKPMSGPQIAAEAEAGNPLALGLYENSAKVIAATVEGMANAMGLSLTDKETAVVFHGGTFNVTAYKDRIKELLQADGSVAPILYTEEFSDNACLDGAALAAIAA